MSELVLTVGGNKATRPITDFQLATIGRGKVYYVDAANGSDGANGQAPKKALATIAEAYDRCTANQNDIVCLIPGASGFTIDTAITWSKGYTHMTGLSAPCMNPRARIGNDGETLASLLTVSGTGCMFKNFRIGNYGTDATALGNVIVSGSRNWFKDVTFFGPGHATPAAETGSRVLTLSGAEENRFEDCYIGGDTVARGAAGFIMELTGACSRNEFIRCKFVSKAETVSYALIKIANTVSSFHLWEDPMFFNFSVNHATTLTEVFDVTVTDTQDHLFINPRMFGIAELDAGDVAGFKVVGAAVAAASGIGVVPTT